MVLLLCYSYHLGLLCVRTAQIHLSYTCGTTCNPQKLGTQNDGVEKNTSSFLNPYTQYPCIISAERFFAFYVYKVDYSSNYVIVITFTSYKRFPSPISLKSSPSQGRLQKKVTPRKTDADCCVDQNTFWFFFHTHTMYCCIHGPICIYIHKYMYIPGMYILQHEKTSAAIPRISAKLIYASCVGYFDRAFLWIYVTSSRMWVLRFYVNLLVLL